MGWYLAVRSLFWVGDFLLAAGFTINWTVLVIRGENTIVILLEWLFLCYLFLFLISCLSFSPRIGFCLPLLFK